MKKALLLAGVASLFSLNAQATEIKPVVGLDYVYSIADIDDIDDEGDKIELADKLNAFALSAGVKFNQYAGLEAFYQQSEKADKTTYVEGEGYEIKDSYKAYGLDAVGYFPVIPQLDLIGSLGMAYYKVEAKIVDSNEKVSDNRIGYRAGIGLQYNYDEHIAARVMARYNYINMDGLNNIVDLTAGVRFYF